MSEVEIIVLVLTIIIGLIVGSFLNVVIYRFQTKLSIIAPASHCPKCKKPIAWYDNIPVFSYLMLRGKCRHCHEVISPRHLMVELLNSALWVIAFYYFRVTPLFFLSIVVVSILLVITMIDLDQMIIPDYLNMGLLIIGIISLIIPANFNGLIKITIYDQLIGLGVGVILLAIVYLIEKIFKKEVIGGGDIKLIGAMGLLLGWQLVLFGIVFGSLIGSVIELPLRLIKIKKRDDLIPFGPYLVIGFLTSMFVGPLMITWYIQLF